MAHKDFCVSANSPLAKLLDELIERAGCLSNKWDKFFVVSENTDVDQIDGQSLQVPDLSNFSKIASNLMLHCGLLTNDICDDNINVEFHRAQYDETYDGPKTPIFCVHMDDYGGVYYPVHTLIIYKTNNLVGGNFAFYYNDLPDTEPSIIIDIQDVPENSMKVMVFDGKLYHNALPIVSGERYALSFQIKKY